jgi:hypothetical protein
MLRQDTAQKAADAVLPYLQSEVSVKSSVGLLGVKSGGSN